MTGIAIGVAILAGAAVHSWAVALLLSGAVLCGAVIGGRRLIGPAVAVVFALVLGTWRGDAPGRPGSLAWGDRATGIEGRVASVPASNGRRQHFVVAVEEAISDEARRVVRARVWVSAPLYPAVGYGDRVWLIGDVLQVEDQPAGFRGFLRSRRVDGAVVAGVLRRDAAPANWRGRIGNLRGIVDRRLASAAPGDAGALLAGLVTGDDGALSEESREAFLRTGTSHLTAVSGSNLALLVTMASTLGTATGWRRRWGWQALTLGAVWGYALLVGLGPPATRAALVATGGVLAVRVGRRPDYPTLLVLAAAVMVVVQPGNLWSLSFQLSFAASLALASVLPGLQLRGLGGWTGAAIAGTLAVEIATLPMLLPLNGSVSLTSVPANMLVAPWVAVAFPVAALASAVGFVSEPAGEALGAVAALLVRPVLLVVETLGGVESGTVPVGRPGGAVSLLLSVGAALVVGALSWEGRACAFRLFRWAGLAARTKGR